MAIGQLDTLTQGTAKDLRTLQVKLTYVGPQTKPVPTVVFTTFHHIIRMDWFLPLRRTDLHYDNDDIAVWNFTVTPGEMKQVVTMLAGLETLQAPHETEAPFLSLMLVLQDSRLGEVAIEAVLDQDGAEVVTRAIRDALDENNGLGRNVVDLQRQVVFPQTGGHRDP